MQGELMNRQYSVTRMYVMTLYMHTITACCLQTSGSTWHTIYCFGDAKEDQREMMESLSCQEGFGLCLPIKHMVLQLGHAWVIVGAKNMRWQAKSGAIGESNAGPQPP